MRLTRLPSRRARAATPRHAGAVLLCFALTCAATPAMVLARDAAFEGQLVNLRGDGRTKDGVVELGGQMSNRGADGTTLFGVSLGLEQAYLVFLWKPAADAPKIWSGLEGAAVEAWLWTDPYLHQVFDSKPGADPVRKFIDATPGERRRIDGVFELKGKVDIRRFKSNVDFLIDVDLATAGKPPRKLKGEVRIGDGGEAEADAAPPRKAPAPPKGVELGQPMGAVRAYAEGLRDGDEAKLRALFHTAGKRSEGYVDLIVRWAKSSVRLERAAAAKFGPAGADEVMGALWLPSAGSVGRGLLENLDAAEVEAKDDQASVRIEPVGLIELRRVEGQWGMFVPEPRAARGRAGGDDEIAPLKLIADVQEAVAPAVETGTHATAADAIEALERAGEKAAAELRQAADKAKESNDAGKVDERADKEPRGTKPTSRP